MKALCSYLFYLRKELLLPTFYLELLKYQQAY
nr:MAG TPA: hypothetical protein [Crassvirales sp.]